jgi:EAL domain-containing protein (putative c-di-GMP-specific phosphodiesterase class I)
LPIVQSIISLTHALDRKVVAEGVETEEQAQALRGLRCDQYQGYLFSKPLPLEDIKLLLSASRERGGVAEKRRAADGV